MILKPCVQCGEPSSESRCSAHRPVDSKAPREARGYDHAWKELSRRARRLQPFCSQCGATEDLQGDHTPTAWERHAAGLPIRLKDIDVLCGRCNRDAGAARGRHTRGRGPSDPRHHPDGKAQSPLHTAGGSG